MKFNIGDKLHISGDIKITGEQSHSSGSYSYNTNLGVAFPAYVLEQLTAASIKPQDKPKFKAGDKAKIIANTCRHAKQIGDIVTLSEPYMPSHNQPAWHCNELFGYIAERDMEPYTEPKPEPAKAPEAVKLYCTEDRCPGYALTKGKIYTFDGHRLDYDELKCFYANDFEDYKRGDWSYADCLVPLVSRPAKAGEWVLVKHTSEDSGGISVGDVALVVEVNNGCGPYIRSKEKTVFGYSELGNVTLLKDDWCEVLDGYDGRYEQTEQPKLYSGKVVCVEARFPLTNSFTAGKVYTFENGKVADNDGDARPLEDAMETLAGWNEEHGDIAKFIEYKGEAT